MLFRPKILTRCTLCIDMKEKETLITIHFSEEPRDMTREERLLEILGIYGYFDESGKWVEGEQ